MLLPDDAITVAHMQDAPTGCVAWCPMFPDETFVLCEVETWKLAVGFGSAQIWSEEREKFHGFSTFVTDIEWQVDPRSFILYDELPKNQYGALIVTSDAVSLHIPSPSGRGFHAALVSKKAIARNLRRPAAYTRWKAVTRNGEESIVVLDPLDGAIAS